MSFRPLQPLLELHLLQHQQPRLAQHQQQLLEPSRPLPPFRPPPPLLVQHPQPRLAQHPRPLLEPSRPLPPFWPLPQIPVQHPQPVLVHSRPLPPSLPPQQILVQHPQPVLEPSWPRLPRLPPLLPLPILALLPPPLLEHISLNRHRQHSKHPRLKKLYSHRPQHLAQPPGPFKPLQPLLGPMLINRHLQPRHLQLKNPQPKPQSKHPPQLLVVIWIN